MNETFLTEKSRAEYRDLPSADFTVEDVMAGGRTRIRLRRRMRAAGAAAAVTAGVLALGPGLGLMDRTSTVAVPGGSASATPTARVSVGCLAPDGITACEGRIRSWAATSGGQWDLRDSTFIPNSEYGAGGRSIEVTHENRSGAADISEYLQIVIVPARVKPAAQFPNLPFVRDSSALSDGSQTWVSPMADATHIDGTVLEGIDGHRASVVIILKADDNSVSNMKPSVAPLPTGWNKDVRDLLEALIA